MASRVSANSSLGQESQRSLRSDPEVLNYKSPSALTTTIPLERLASGLLVCVLFFRYRLPFRGLTGLFGGIHSPFIEQSNLGMLR
jgi:hypothetical protein